MKENEDIIKKLVQAEDIHYIESEKELQGYETENIINVIVGIRGINKPLKKENTKDTRAKEKRNKEEELQRIRNLTAKLSLDKKKNKKNIEKNKEEMDKIKKEIEKIELEIKKNQMNEK
jgi:valyl-tRNA synthetase